MKTQVPLFQPSFYMFRPSFYMFQFACRMNTRGYERTRATDRNGSVEADTAAPDGLRCRLQEVGAGAGYPPGKNPRGLRFRRRLGHLADCWPGNGQFRQRRSCYATW